MHTAFSSAAHAAENITVEAETNQLGQIKKPLFMKEKE
jgi:hypothetical protein